MVLDVHGLEHGESQGRLQLCELKLRWQACDLDNLRELVEGGLAREERFLDVELNQAAAEAPYIHRFRVDW